MDLAVGIMVGASFNAVINALVKDLFTPLIAAIFKYPDFSGMAFTLNGSKFPYGEFINALISFIVISATIYFFAVLPINTLNAKTQKEKKPTTKKCLECLSDVPIDATRCAFCGVKIEDKI